MRFSPASPQLMSAHDHVFSYVEVTGKVVTGALVHLLERPIED